MTLTPEEKAVQLVDALYDGSNIKKAIALAMFVVNEIIESRKDDKYFDDRDFAKSSDYFTPHPMGFTYWKEVKNELFNFKQQDNETKQRRPKRRDGCNRYDDTGVSSRKSK